ncbi:beta-glucosidase BglX [Sediminibacterium ginsengisoli]|uniref:Periplasmic beta-glucosidase n=1 Tax=Sediminibacterium ginsengisoli TaxID=413434 RepID=A0A1T4RCN0_9BACT|nr:beta-glucosidase BglX [Sediminibacterium ginsengisoli]SKA13669.1 beta-glucosidase [Sediminibacterium ginsengisoli]
MTRYSVWLVSCTLLCQVVTAQVTSSKTPDATDKKVAALLAKMTLEEKIGQLNQYTGDRITATGPLGKPIDKVQQVREGKIGSLLNVKGVAETRKMQEAAMESRLKIPLLFGLDVIHGYKVTFPIPLAEAASWDLAAIENAARIAGKEAAAAGLHWTFAPMVDISRDPRWGRVMEGAGEDPYLGSLIAKARVKGFQGAGLGDTAAVMACVKHFAAYGAAIAGRDYNTVDMSPRLLWEVYLPPFKAALDAGAATFMNSFNELNGVPATASSYLQRDILKGKWNFKGFVVSDWNSIGEMVPHGFAADRADAARLAITAGSDMDMESHSYIDHLQKLVTDKKVSIALIDDAVSRILRKKFELGLFDDPFRFSNEAREKKIVNAPEHKAAARDMARKSIVLLKNENGLLPLSTDKKIAVIGPLAKSKTDMKGFWSVKWNDEDELVSLYEGLEARVGKDALLYAKGCGIKDSSRAGFDEAVATAAKADIVVLAVGETFDMSGEAKSRANIHLPGIQEELVKALHATGKPVVVLVMAGRPLIFNWTADHAPAIVYTWWLGTEAGHAMADVLFGNYNPSGKLPMSFPRSEGQIPVYYNYNNTGRPSSNDKDINYRSAYIDMPNSPRYAFGYGLSYTGFKYDALNLSTEKLQRKDPLQVSFTLTNTGKYAGEEVVQLYIRDMVASVVRPVKELKGFQKIMLRPGESKTISFRLTEADLSFYNNDLKKITEAGTFKLMIGSASNDIRLEKSFELIN